VGRGGDRGSGGVRAGYSTETSIRRAFSGSVRPLPADHAVVGFFRVTSPLGAPLGNSNFRRQVWYRAVEDAGLPEGLRIHDLRHTCACLLISASANPKAVQVHLGHSSIAVTMDRYTHLFSSDTKALQCHPPRMAPNLAPS
jgi:integrase